MSVPNTSTFSMSNVKTELTLGGYVNNDLISMFSFANGIFDPSYVGSKNNLLNFRNYNHGVLACSTAYLLFEDNGAETSVIIDTNTKANYANPVASDSWIHVTTFNNTWYVSCDYLASPASRNGSIQIKDSNGYLYDTLYIYQNEVP